MRMDGDEDTDEDEDGRRRLVTALADHDCCWQGGAPHSLRGRGG